MLIRAEKFSSLLLLYLMQMLTMSPISLKTVPRKHSATAML